MKQLNGMSQQEFANQIGISQDKVSRMENDPSQVSVEILLRIAAHFGMSLDELIKVPTEDSRHARGLHMELRSGDSDAYTHGSNAGRLRKAAVALTTVTTAAAVRPHRQRCAAAFLHQTDRL